MSDEKRRKLVMGAPIYVDHGVGRLEAVTAREAVSQAIIAAIDPGQDHATGGTKVAVYVDDFTDMLARHGYCVQLLGSDQ